MKNLVIAIAVLSLLGCSSPNNHIQFKGIEQIHSSMLNFSTDSIQIDGDLKGFDVKLSSQTLENGLEVVRVLMTSTSAQTPPKFSLKWKVPSIDIHKIWNPNFGVNKANFYYNSVNSSSTHLAPVISLLNSNDENRMTVAIADALNKTNIQSYIKEEDAMFHFELSFFDERYPAIKEYSTEILIDRRKKPFYHSLAKVSQWWAEHKNYKAAPVPDDAMQPMYSTWYSYHQNLDVDAVVEECREGKEMGMKAVIVDDGWQTLDNKRGYAYTGDWKPDRIPDMKGFVDQIHQLNMKFILWYSVPFIGKNAENYPRFKGKYLYYWESQGAWVLDPRYPEVREFIINIYEEAMRDWGLDGFKLDFMGFFHPDKDSKLTAEDGRDFASVNHAVDQLMGFIGEDDETNKFAVEALADIQDIYSLDKLTSLLSSSITIVRDTAIDQLMKLGNKATPILTKASRNAEADYLIHLITTLGYIGDPAAVTSILDIVNTQPKDANIRQAAYEAMERIPSPKTAISLVQGLQDPVEAVRMSAARAIDKNLSKALVAGLRNVVREGSLDSKNAVAALIDSEASNIFNFLAEEESFMELAKTHVTTKADSATRKAFLKQMASIGQKKYVETIGQEVTKDGHPSGKGAQIFVIDDSKMMLKLYQNKLTALGFKPITFDRPEDAIPQIIQKKPDLIITDLNMPNISGLELTREIRKKFTRQDLPILMITTQSDFVEEKDGDIKINDSILTKSGINQILHKPFTDEEFHEAIDNFLKP